MMKEKINDTEPGIKQIEREIERGCDNAKKNTSGPGLFPTSSFSALFQIFPEFHHEF